MKSKLQVFNDFRNNVMCRREINQHKAWTIWEDIKKYIPEKESREFTTDWNHYTLGHDSMECFTISIYELKKYFE